MRVPFAALVSVIALSIPARAIAEPDGEAPATSGFVREHLRAEARGSFVIVDKHGVPDALRGGASVGACVLRRGALGVSIDAVGVFGYSEKIGHSYRFGANLELDWHLPSIGASTYTSMGAHYFASRAEEDRTGLLLRGALGFRIFTSPRVYVGFEPFALERVPDGDGIQTPVRSRWAWEMTFISIGFQ